MAAGKVVEFSALYRAPILLLSLTIPYPLLHDLQRGQPLTAEQWAAFVQKDGRVIEESKLRSLVFRGVPLSLSFSLSLTHTTLSLSQLKILTPSTSVCCCVLFHRRRGARRATPGLVLLAGLLSLSFYH